MGGRSSKKNSLSNIPDTAASAIATNATTVMIEEMKRDRKETAVQMKQLTAMLLSATTNTTPLPATTPPAADEVFYNPSAARRVRHPPPKKCADVRAPPRKTYPHLFLLHQKLGHTRGKSRNLLRVYMRPISLKTR